MNDKLKNVISNFLGLIIVCVSIYSYIFDYINLTGLGALSILGLALFLFKVNESRNWLDKLFTRKLEK